MVRIFEGKEPHARVLLGLDQITSFQTRVYSVLKRIPRGRVTNYGLIAKAIGSGPRAVGQAVGSNPYPPFVPCHRVVPFDMSVGNYSMSSIPGHGRPDVKRNMLEREGIGFQGERILPSALWRPW
jgi:methylated-DNA-[protein]-cysteine S-methyltransferase